MKGITKKLHVLVFCLAFLAALALGGRVEAKAAGTITMTVERFSIGGDFLVEPKVMQIQPGDTYASMVTRAILEAGYTPIYEGSFKSGYYLQGILEGDVGSPNVPDVVMEMLKKKGITFGANTKGGLFEFSYTERAGWMYYVNNEWQTGMSLVTPKNDDVCRVFFTLNHGADLTGKLVNMDTGAVLDTFYKTADKSDLVRAMGALNETRSQWQSNSAYVSAYNNAKNVMAKFDASEASVLAARTKLLNLQGQGGEQKPGTDPGTGEDPGTDPGVSPLPDNATKEEFKEGKPQFTAKAAADGKSVAVTWSAYPGADGYEVMRRVNGSGAFKTIKTAGQKESSYTDEDVKPGTTYNYTVVAVSTEWGKSDYDRSTKVAVPAYPASETEKPVEVKAPAKTTLKGVTAKKKQAVLKWKKAARAEGYEVCRAIKKNGSYAVVKTIKKGGTVTYTDKKLKSKKIYYYKIRAYRTVEGEKVYGTYSAVKSVKVK